MPRHFPSISALKAFESFSRRGTLAGAADELCISSSAVSHQIKALEAFLNTKLFIRRSTGLEITSAGRDYLAGIAPALDRIEAETVRFASQSASRGLVINTYQSLSQFWLIPLLPRFFDSNPDISIRLVSMPDEIDLSGSEVDLAIRHSREQPVGFYCHKLFDEYACPVASPDYLAQYPAIRTAADLAAHRLIECTWFGPEWDDWFEERNEKSPTTPRFMCDQRSQAFSAAEAGLGVALDLSPNGSAKIARGSLHPLTDLASPTGGAYYLIAPERSVTLHHVKAFIQWLKRVSKQERQFMPPANRH